MTKIKLCGLTRLVEADYANEAAPDFTGFVFDAGRHFVTDELAAAIRKRIDPAIPAVGIFVREDQDHIVRLVEAGVIQYVQLHGGESEDYIRRLKERISCPFIKVISVTTKEDVLKGAGTAAEYLLLDHGRGGTGQAFDWREIPPIEKKWFMAGGIGMDNLEEALSFHPWAVDISSGAETDGVKDIHKMKALVAMAHRERRRSK